MTQVKNFETAFSLVPLEDLLESYIGGDWGIAPDSDDPEYVDVKCIRATELKNWTNEKAQTAAPRKIKKSSLVKRNLLEGDIILEISGGGPEQPVGRVEIITKEVISSNHAENLVCTNFFRMLRPNSQVIPKFLKLYLDFFYLCGPIKELQSGSNNLRNLQFNDYLKIQVPLPDIEQQDSIIQDIEIANSQIDSGVAALCDAEQMLELYRQSVLKDAFEGKLTADWRAVNPDLVEPVDKLLARIEAERKAAHQAEVDAWECAVTQWEANGKDGKKPSKPKKPDLTPVIFGEENSENLPKNWAKVHISSVLDPQSGSTPKGISNVTNGTVNYIKVADMNAVGNEIKIQKSKMTLDDKSIADLSMNLMPEGTVIFPKRGGAIKTDKKRALLRPSCVDTNIMGLVNSSQSILNNYVFSFMKSFTLFEISDGSNIPQINKGSLKVVAFPICSSEEQREICRIVDEKFEKIDNLRKSIAVSFSQANALKQTIFKQAFSGHEMLEEAS